MKHTVKIDRLQAIVLQPTAEKTGLQIDLVTCGVTVITKTLTPDQAAAVGFGIESVMEVIQVHAESVKRMPAGAGLRCHDGDACKAGQAPCPTPGACGVAA